MKSSSCPGRTWRKACLTLNILASPLAVQRQEAGQLKQPIRRKMNPSEDHTEKSTTSGDVFVFCLSLLATSKRYKHSTDESPRVTS